MRGFATIILLLTGPFIIAARMLVAIIWLVDICMKAYAERRAWAKAILQINTASAGQRSQARRAFPVTRMPKGWHWDACDRVVRF